MALIVIAVNATFRQQLRVFLPAGNSEVLSRQARLLLPNLVKLPTS